MTDPTASPHRRRGLLPIVVAALGAAALAGAAYRLTGPTLVFSNQLIVPVRLTVDGAVQVVPPGGAVRSRLSRQMLVAEWEAQRPLSASGEPMGEVVRGSAVVPEPRGTVVRAAAPRVESGDYFAPLITNDTDRLLRITVNAGLDGALDCRCAVRPGARRVFLGYYRLYRNSTVQATDPAGHQAIFRDLGAEAQARDWTVGLRFANADFAAAPRP